MLELDLNKASTFSKIKEEVARVFSLDYFVSILAVNTQNFPSPSEKQPPES